MVTLNIILLSPRIVSFRFFFSFFFVSYLLEYACQYIFGNFICDYTANGIISRDEWIENTVSKFGATSEQAATMFNKLDSAGQGQITLDALVEQFKAMDADGITHYSIYSNQY